MKKLTMVALFLILAGTLTACSTGSPTYYSTTGPRSSGPFTSTYVPGLTQPEITFINKTDRPIRVFLSGGSTKSLSVPAMSSRTISVPEGTYSYNISADDLEAMNGMQTFQKEYRYTWTIAVN